MYHIEKRSTREIARMEGGVNHKAIIGSIRAAEKKFIKSIKNTSSNGTHFSKYIEEVIHVSGESSSSTSND